MDVNKNIEKGFFVLCAINIMSKKHGNIPKPGDFHYLYLLFHILYIAGDLSCMLCIVIFTDNHRCKSLSFLSSLLLRKRHIFCSGGAIKFYSFLDKMETWTPGKESVLLAPRALVSCLVSSDKMILCCCQTLKIV